jgi:hypothetical protein
MTSSPRHGAPGCPCEECLTARIRLTAELAADGRDMTGLRARLDDFRVLVTTAPVTLRSVS